MSRLIDADALRKPIYAEEDNVGRIISALESIDRITAERDKAIAERDALMKDLEKVPLCHSCKYDLSGNGGVCFECAINAGSKWEWRGVQND